MASILFNSSQFRLPLSKRMLIGAGIALSIITLFLFSIKEPDPAWGKYWMIRPLFAMAIAGAVGGLCNYAIINFRSLVGFTRAAAILLSIIVSVLGLLMGFVVGLNGML